MSNFNVGDRVICSIPTDNTQLPNGFNFSGAISMFGGQEIAGIVARTDGPIVADYKKRGVEVVGVFFDALRKYGLGHNCDCGGAISKANGGQWVYTALLRHEEDDVFDRAYAESALDALLAGGSL